MALADDIEQTVSGTLAGTMNEINRVGTLNNVPKPEDIGYSDGVKMKLTYLYVDMADSTGLVRTSPASTVAAVLRVYLETTVRVIRTNSGHIRSFDGDRVMGIFSGENREDRAVKSSMQINWAIREMIQPALVKKFGSISRSGWTLSFAGGIATSDTTLIRVGIRSNSDLVSIGAAANLAARLSERREGDFRTFIGKGAYGNTSDAAKLSSGKNMWQGPYSQEMGGTTYEFYRSSYKWKL